MKLISLSAILVAALVLASCSDSGKAPAAKKRPAEIPVAKKASPPSSSPMPKPTDRVYNAEQVARGEKIFLANCTKCHGKYAEGEPYWQTKNKEGNLPPPPLDGTGHAWHHPTDILEKYIKEGGEKLGGTMKGFEGKLSDGDITDVIVWITSLWPDDVYKPWYRRDQMTRNYKKETKPGF